MTCTADLAPPGTLEVEVGDQLRRIGSGGGNQNATPILIKLPLATWIEAQLGTNGYTVAPGARYLDNITAAAKLHVFDQVGQRPSIAFTIAASVPTAAQQGYTRTYDLFATAHASKDYGELHLDWNVGVDAWRVEGPVSYQAFTALAAAYAITKRLSAAIEPHYFSDAAPLAPRDVGAIAAIAYAVRPWLVIDGAFDAVLADQGSIAGLVGVSLAPVRVWRGR